MICIKPEVIQCAEANRVGVLILRKRFRAPGDRATILDNIPRCAAITLVVKRAVVCPAGMLKRRMKSNIRNVYSGSKRDAERLDGAIEVLVIERVFVMVNTGRRVGDFVTHEPNAVVARIRFDLIHRRTGPSHDGRLLSHRGANASKTKGLIDPSYVVATPRSVVIHVALARMTLAPGVFVWDDVLRFSKIRRSRVQRRVQVVHVNQDSVRRYVMTVAAVIVRGRTREISGEWIDPGARTDAALTAVQAGAVCVGAAGAKMAAAYAIASKAACV